MVEVLLMHHHLLVPYASELMYERDFVCALAGIEGKGGHLSDRLLPFSKFLTRFNKAAFAFTKLSASAGVDYPKKLTRVHGLAWKEMNQHLPDEVGADSVREPVTALEAAEFVSMVAEVTIINNIGDVCNPQNSLMYDLVLQK
jgi:hypothetical protein